QDLLQLRRGQSRSAAFGPPTSDDYQLSNMDVLKRYWAVEPVGGATGRGTSPANKFRQLAHELAAEPDGKEALVQFAAQDFYDATMRTGTFNLTAAEKWMVDHQNKLRSADIPELQAAFTGVRNRMERIRQVETQSAGMLETLSAERLRTVRLAQDARTQETARSEEHTSEL